MAKDAEAPKPQPPALRLANMSRALRARAREYTSALWALNDAKSLVTLDMRASATEEREVALERAAIDYANAWRACNSGTPPG